ncbi:transposase [Streptomyces hydrogenans]|uniref:transposase n=1 Tax=Streptomyces hydrogenans TaxID=1873719 RepID=UPI003432D5CA
MSDFRAGFYGCVTAQADALFELTDAMLCVDRPVKTLVNLTLTSEHRRDHGALYDGLNRGRTEVDRLRAALSGLSLPRAADGRIVLAMDVSPWLRSDAPTSADRLFCHVYRRVMSTSQFIPGWLYSFMAALESGPISWTTMLDAVRLGPQDDTTAVTADQRRLARPLAEDLRRPWKRPASPGRLTPARVRRGFRNFRAKSLLPASASKPGRPGPGRPFGFPNRQKPPRYGVGKTELRDLTIKERQQRIEQGTRRPVRIVSPPGKVHP